VWVGREKWALRLCILAIERSSGPLLGAWTSFRTVSINPSSPPSPDSLRPSARILAFALRVIGPARWILARNLPIDTRQTDPDLAVVVDPWDRLPKAVRAGIVAMVRAATRG
jgi:hypothetical protein